MPAVTREDDLFKRIRFEFDLSEKRSILQAYAEYEQFEQNENIHRERRELAVMIYRNIHAEFGRAGVRIVVISALIKPCKSSIKDSKAKMSGALALGLSLEKGIVLLANKEIHPGDFIIQYTGEVITHGEFCVRHQALGGAHHHNGIQIDGHEMIDTHYKACLLGSHSPRRGGYICFHAAQIQGHAKRS
ncbi:hypothetical protein PC111_g18294 [Phytophthora cactorum]|nr:hypothetical protein PC111_g18294 [Phytophthora cactorum]